MVITIIGVLIGLLLPAVSAEAAEGGGVRQQPETDRPGPATCIHAARECFPPAGIGYGWCESTPSYPGDNIVLNASGLMTLSPYLDQVPLYSMYDQKQCACYTAGCYGPPFGTLAGNPATNAQVVSTRLAVLTCPSDNGDPYFPGGQHHRQRCGRRRFQSSQDQL